VRVTVRQEPDRLLLSVQDDGKGFDTRQERGMGLLESRKESATWAAASQWIPSPGRAPYCASCSPCRSRRKRGRSHETDSNFYWPTTIRLCGRACGCCWKASLVSRWSRTPPTGAKPWRWPKNITPDVVVMDVAMPMLNGIEAATQISAKLPQIAIVFLSMHSDEGYVLKALKRAHGLPAERLR